MSMMKKIVYGSTDSGIMCWTFCNSRRKADEMNKLLINTRKSVSLYITLRLFFARPFVAGCLGRNKTGSSAHWWMIGAGIQHKKISMTILTLIAIQCQLKPNWWNKVSIWKSVISVPCCLARTLVSATIHSRRQILGPSYLGRIGRVLDSGIRFLAIG